MVRIVDELGSEVPAGAISQRRAPPIPCLVTGTTRWARSGRSRICGYRPAISDGSMPRATSGSGRAKLMISRGGFKIAPPMVEDALRAHPAAGCGRRGAVAPGAAPGAVAFYLLRGRTRSR
jgi:acyl-CoA synthetase (AMP-forming)/AMP-acid ligase II